MGLILAIGLAFMSEGLDHTVSRPEQVEGYLGRPVWGSVNLFEGHLMPPAGALREQFRTIAAKLENVGQGCVIVVSSASDHAGATTVVAGLAHVLSSDLGRKTLVLEVTDQDSMLGKVFSPNSSKIQQVSFAQNGWREAFTTVRPCLQLVSSKPQPGSLAGKQIAERIRELQGELQDFEYILVDTSPSLSSYERIGLARGSSGVALVVDWGQTHYEALERLRGEYDREGVALLGAVLNRRRFPIPGRLYKST